MNLGAGEGSMVRALGTIPYLSFACWVSRGMFATINQRVFLGVDRNRGGDVSAIVFEYDQIKRRLAFLVQRHARVLVDDVHAAVTGGTRRKCPSRDFDSGKGLRKKLLSS